MTCECDTVTLLCVTSGDRLVVSQTRQFLTSLPLESTPENAAGIKWSRIAKTAGGRKATKKETETTAAAAMEGVELQMDDVGFFF